MSFGNLIFVKLKLLGFNDVIKLVEIGIPTLITKAE